MMPVAIDVAVDKVHDLVACLSAALPYYQKLTLLQFPHSSLFILGANAINGATSVYANHVGKPRLYWLHSLVLVIIGAFGGGTLAPLLLGKPSMIVWNDQIIFCCLVAWYATHQLGFQRFLTWLPVKMLWTVFLGLFRAHSVINIVIASMTVLVPTPYYPIPIIGPIVVGTAVGCLGLFLPLDKGMAPIKNGTPWNLQGALMTAIFYHLMVHDKTGFLGNTLRAIMGTYDASTSKTILATMHIVSLELQAIFNGDANLFTPVHKLLYLVFQVAGPTVVVPAKELSPTAGWDIKTRARLGSLLAGVKMAIVLGAVGGYVYSTFPAYSLCAVPEGRWVSSILSLPAGGSDGSAVEIRALQSAASGDWKDALCGSSRNTLQLGDVIGSCQLLQPARLCAPYLMRLEASTAGDAGSCSTGAEGDGYCQRSYELSVYQGSRITSDTPVHWSLQLPVIARLPSEGEVDAVAALASPAATESSEGKLVSSGEVALQLSAEGELLLTQKVVNKVAPSDGNSTVAVLWSSDVKYCQDSSAQSLSVDSATGQMVVVCSDGSTVSAAYQEL